MSNLIEPASSGRSSCRGCGKKIAKAELRFGECKPNPFGEGDATYWFHLVCAACTRPEGFLLALAKSDLPLADRVWLREAAERGAAHPRLPRLLSAERSPSSRALCRSCRILIEKGAWRFALGIFEESRMEPIGFIHVSCAGDYFETSDVLDRVARLSPDLSREALAELGRALTSPASTETMSGGPGLSKASQPADVSAKQRAAGTGRER